MHTAPNLPRTPPCQTCAARHLIGIGVGGRFSTEAASFLRLLAQHRAAGVAAPLRAAARAGWVQRWSGMLAVAAIRACAASLLELPAAGEPCLILACVAGKEPEVLADVRGNLRLTCSRLPAPTPTSRRVGLP